MEWTQSCIILSSEVIAVDGFSRITSPAWWSTADKRMGPVMDDGALLNSQSGAGPGERRVALLCLLQYGAANAAPILADDARRSTVSKRSSSNKSKP